MLIFPILGKLNNLLLIFMCNIINTLITNQCLFEGELLTNISHRKIFIRPFSFLTAKGELARGSAKCGALFHLKQDPIKNIICHPE